ncbi:hypothetical protein C4K02_5179 [Pseudomonas synxantha]|nr:hypothetical protein C4K02_5179 [Pseudomonas synxantha]
MTARSDVALGSVRFATLPTDISCIFRELSCKPADNLPKQQKNE